MLKYNDFLNLNHKQRRKIWKKEKRRRRRIFEFLSRATLKELEPSESEESGDEEVNDNLPLGPLTNFAIICHLRKFETGHSSKSGLKSILQNANESAKPPVQLVDLDFTVTDQPVENGEVTGDKNDVDFVLSNDAGKQLSTEQSFPIHTDDNILDNEEEENLNAVPHTEKENNEINDLLSLLDDEVERWHNPMAPVEVPAPQPEPTEIVQNNDLERNASPEDNRPICNFFVKVGICRFGDKCSRKHSNPDISDTLLFFNMFQTAGFTAEGSKQFSRDVIDDALEHTEQDLYNDFLDFYEDIKPEFEQIGRVVNLFVCSNRVRHLCGNVYVQYENESVAKNCFDKMLGRFYNGKQIFCKFVAIKSWNEAICGIHLRHGSCQRGGQCNFLHIFRKQELSVHHYTRRGVRSTYNNYHNRDYDSKYRSSSRYYYKHYSRSRSRSSSEREDGRHRRKRSKSHIKDKKRKQKRSLKKESKRHDSDVKEEEKKVSKRRYSISTGENDTADENGRKNGSVDRDTELKKGEKDFEYNESTSMKKLKKSKKKKSHKKKKS